MEEIKIKNNIEIFESQRKDQLNKYEKEYKLSKTKQMSITIQILNLEKQLEKISFFFFEIF